MIGTKADIVEVFGAVLAAVANEAGADVAGAVAQSFTGDAPTHEQKRQGDTHLFESPKVPKAHFTRVNRPKTTSPKIVPN